MISLDTLCFYESVAFAYVLLRRTYILLATEAKLRIRIDGKHTSPSKSHTEATKAGLAYQRVKSRGCKRPSCSVFWGVISDGETDASSTDLSDLTR